MLVPQPRSASVTVLEQALVLRVDKAVLDDLLADWPELTEGVIAALVARLRAGSDTRRRAVNEAPPRGVVGLLTGQALAFGVTLALLLVPGNSLFLDAYGSKWLPVTYIATAVLGGAAAALIARATRTARLVRVATATLGALAALFAASWAILVAGGDWVSWALVVTFPIALQIGFVFIGGQAGRLLDVRQMKEFFPRVVSGFAVGFLVGGLVEIPLLALLGSTENLLLATTAAQLSFLGLAASHRTPLPGGESRAGRRRAASGPARHSGSCSRASWRCCSPISCCRRWARRWSTSCSSIGPRRATPAAT